jgi:hypothetical protein
LQKLLAKSEFIKCSRQAPVYTSMDIFARHKINNIARL